MDPPLHEFLPHTKEQQLTLAQKFGMPVELIMRRVQELHEFNPMLGHRGCRLGIDYPEITEMQTRAIIEAAIEVQEEIGCDVRPEIMVGTRRTICINTQVFVIDFNFYIIVNIRPHIHGCKAGLSFPICVKWGNSYQSMHANLVL